MPGAGEFKQHFAIGLADALARIGFHALGSLNAA
jgi:formyltetrahydrofolate synthetase